MAAAHVAAAEHEPERVAKLFRAASLRMSGLRAVLDGFEDRGNRAAVLRTAEALGVLHIHEVNPACAEQGRARGVAHGGEKWLKLHHHADAAECAELLHAQGEPPNKQSSLANAPPPNEAPNEDMAAARHNVEMLFALYPTDFVILAALPAQADGALTVSSSWHNARKKRRQKQQKGSDVSSESAGAAGAAGTADDTRPIASEAAPFSEAPPPAFKPLPLSEVDFAKRLAVVFGSEQLGVSSELLRHCDGALTIPLSGLTESLNVSVAAAIVLHHGRTARTAALERVNGLNAHGGDLSEEAVAELLDDYLQRGKGYSKQIR